MRYLLKMKEKKWTGLALAVVVIITYMTIPSMGLYASGYDYQKAVSYADTWGDEKRNPEYTSYGADCMNYVSQCLYAGGMVTGSDWQPYNSAWVGVTPFVRAMRARGYQVIENPAASQIYPGNPVIYQWKGSSYDWSHATICVGYDSNGVPIVNGHTTDRYHVNWNYAAGSASKMCTILINDGSTPFGNPVDLGDSFFAYINSALAGKPLTNDGDNVSIRSKGISDEAIRSQVWKFVRQEDGSYVIYSSKDDTKVLDVDGAGTVSGTNVQVFVYWGHPAQHWYIYEVDGDYQLRSQCSECLLDVANSGKTDGTNIQMCKSNGYMAQRFQIEKVNTPGITRVYCTPGTGNTPTTLSWNATTDTTVYNVRINGTQQKDVWNVTGTSCQVELPAGNYEVYVNACNAYSYSTSPTVRFTVPEGAAKVQDDIGNSENIIGETENQDSTVGENNRTDGTGVNPTENTQTGGNEVEPTENTQTGGNEVESTEDSRADNATSNPVEEAPIQNIVTNIWNSADNRVANNTITNNTTTNIWNYIFGMGNSNTEEHDVTCVEAADVKADNSTEQHNDYEIRNAVGDAEDYVSPTMVSNWETMPGNEASAETEISAADTSATEDEETNIMNTEITEESGIRVIELRDDSGKLQGIFLRIVYPYNGERQVMDIRLI